MFNPIAATHIASGHTGEVQDMDQYVDANGRTVTRWYFEDHARPTVAGWYYSKHLIIPGVNTPVDVEGV